VWAATHFICVGFTYSGGQALLGSGILQIDGFPRNLQDYS
jgi:hypothetical protein